MRAFLAVTVTEPALSPLLSMRRRLVAEVPGVRWARPDGLHLTLRFFADLDAAAVAPLMDVVAGASAGHSAFDLVLDQTGAFPDGRRPRVIWLGAGSGAAQLTDLFGTVDAAVASAGLGAEEQSFRPHCTIGRPRPAWDHGDSWRAIAAAALPLPPFAVGAVDLYESRDGYRVIASAPLA